MAFVVAGGAVGPRRVAVLAPYRAQGLIRPVHDHWALPRRLGEVDSAVPARRRAAPAGYAGTADAVARNARLIERLRPDHVLVLGGDRIYRTDFACMLAEHAALQADVSVGCAEVPIGRASAFGVVEADDQGWITGWHEKPETPQPRAGDPQVALASLGVYVFGTDVLLDALRTDRVDPISHHDFGRDVIPALIAAGRRVHAHALAVGDGAGVC